MVYDPKGKLGGSRTHVTVLQTKLWHAKKSRAKGKSTDGSCAFFTVSQDAGSEADDGVSTSIFNEVGNDNDSDDETDVRELEQRCAHLAAELAAEDRTSPSGVVHSNQCVLSWSNVLFIKDDRTLLRQEYINSSVRTYLLFDTGANLNCIDFDLFLTLLRQGLVRNYKYFSRYKCLNGTGNGSASICGWAVVIIAFEGITIPVSCDVVINLGVTFIMGCNWMDQLQALLDMDGQNRAIYVRQPDVVIEPEKRCCRGQPVTTVKQLKEPVLVFVSRLCKTSDDAMAGDLNQKFETNKFTWPEGFSDEVETKNYAMVAYNGDQT